MRMIAPTTTSETRCITTNDFASSAQQKKSKKRYERKVSRIITASLPWTRSGCDDDGHRQERKSRITIESRRRRTTALFASSSSPSFSSSSSVFSSSFSNKNKNKNKTKRRGRGTRLQSMISPMTTTLPLATTATMTMHGADAIIPMLQNAILDERSTAIAIASPLFALSVVPYLLFLKNLWRAETATSEQKYAFATLLVFVLISIPAEVYTKERYDTVLSNIDSLHFLIQSAISLTNLRILLAFRDDFDLTTTTTATAEANRNAVSSTTRTSSMELTAADIGRPGAAVEAVAGVILLSTGILMALDDRLIDLSSIDLKATSETSVKFMASVTLTIQNWRDYAQEFDSSFTSLLNVQAPPANALSVPTWGVHVFSLVEWLVAMGFVWDYGTRTQHRGWKLLTLAMLPLHASGICAVTQHFFNNDPSLEWLVALQGAFTMVGNISLFYAAKVLANEEPKLDVFLPSANEEDEKEEESAKVLSTTEPWKEKARIEIWDVERLGLIFEKDDEFAFSFKIALVSVGIAAFVRGASLVFAPEFDYNALGSSNHHDELNAYALLFVFIPLLINYVKWQLRFRAEEEESALLKIGSGKTGAQ